MSVESPETGHAGEDTVVSPLSRVVAGEAGDVVEPGRAAASLDFASTVAVERATVSDENWPVPETARNRREGHMLSDRIARVFDPDVDSEPCGLDGLSGECGWARSASGVMDHASFGENMPCSLGGRVAVEELVVGTLDTADLERIAAGHGLDMADEVEARLDQPRDAAEGIGSGPLDTAAGAACVAVDGHTVDAAGARAVWRIATSDLADDARLEAEGPDCRDLQVTVGRA